MTTKIQISVPATMGKPWAISEKTGHLKFVRIKKIDDSATVIFEAANRQALIQTQVDGAIFEAPTRFNVCVPAKIFRSMKATRASFKGSPWRYSIDLYPDHKEKYAEVSYGDGMTLRGDLGDNPRLPSFEDMLPDISDDMWLHGALPKRAVDGDNLVRTVDAMTKITRAVQIYFPGQEGKRFVIRKFKEGVGSRSTAVLMPTFVEW